MNMLTSASVDLHIGPSYPSSEARKRWRASLAISRASRTSARCSRS